MCEIRQLAASDLSVLLLRQISLRMEIGCDCKILGGNMFNVSVIVPVYNTERYLKRCLDSLIHQTLKELEVIAVDDGSTDHSYELLMEYEANYPDRIKVYSKGNGGQATARNLGILKSTGKYIGFVDSDDSVDAKMFETMFRTAEQNQCDMVECHYHYLCEEGKRTREYRTRGAIRQYKDQKDMFINAQASPCNKLFRRGVILHEGVDFPEGFIYEDTGFYLKTIPYIRKEYFLDQQFYYYYLRSSSTMNANRSRKVGNIFPVLQNVLDFYRSHDFYTTYEKELEYFCVKILLCSSLSRIGRVPDHRLARKLYEQTFSFIRENFPGYRNNPYLQGKIGLYLKLVNRRNCKYIGKLLGRIMKG